MPRKKVKLAFIDNIKSRKSSYIKRKESLKKKLYELCTLCDVMACLILYSPNESKPELWPDDKDVILHVVRQYKAKPKIERSNKILNQESYLMERINKAKEKLNKLVMANHELEKANMLSDCLSGKVLVADLNQTALKELVSMTGLKILDINERMELLSRDVPATAVTPELQHSQPLKVVGDSSAANSTIREGIDVEPFVPVMVNTGALDDAQNFYWFPSEWVSDQEVDGSDTIPKNDMTNSLTKDLWSGTFFPKNV